MLAPMNEYAEALITSIAREFACDASTAVDVAVRSRPDPSAKISMQRDIATVSRKKINAQVDKLHSSQARCPFPECGEQR